METGIAVVDKTLELYWKKLLPILETKCRGMVLADEEIRLATGIVHIERLHDRIRKHFKRLGIKVKHRPDPINGFVLMTDYEQLKDVGIGINSIAHKSLEVASECDAIDPLQLDDKERKTHEHSLDITKKIAADAISHRAKYRYLTTGRKSTLQLRG